MGTVGEAIVRGFAMILLTAVTAIGAADPAKPLSDAQRKAMLSTAPQPKSLTPGLKLTLVDFIECSSLAATHAYTDDGHSRIRATGLGAFRETGANDSSFFAYRLFVKNIHQPHLLVVEYPNDAERTVSIFLHEDGMRGTYNSDFHVEAGYSTGGSYPLTNTFNTFQAIVWPSTIDPAVVVLNQHHGSPAAASKIWLYEIQSPLPQAEVNAPAGPTRQVGIFFEDTRMFRFNFGLGGGGIDHCMQYLKYTGQNLLSYDAVIYGYPKCKVPAFGGRGNNETEAVLAAADRYGIDVIATFDPTKGFKVNGTPTGDLTDAAVIDGWAEALEQFVDIYGKHPSLKGISFGGPAGCNRMSSPKFAELQKKINTMLQAKRPDIVQHVYFGYRFLHRFIFNENDFRADKIVKAWEDAGADRSFRSVLTTKVSDYFDSIHLNIDDYRDLPGVMVHRSYYPNDHRCFRFYPLRTPRYMIFRDYNEAEGITELTKTDSPNGACLFGNYFEVTTPLMAGVNFWWDRTWIAPTINPAEPFFVEAYANALAQQDFPLIMNSSWVNPIIGGPHKVREFALAFRSLPAKTFATAAESNSVVARELSADGVTYMYVLNNHPSPAEVKLSLSGQPGAVTNLVDGKQIADGDSMTLALAPYALATYRTQAGRKIAAMDVSRADKDLEPLRARIDTFDTNIGQLVDDKEPISLKYRRLYDKVAKLFNDGDYQKTAAELSWTIPHELALRTFISRKKEVFNVPAIAEPIAIDADLKDWPKMLTIELVSPENIVCDRWLFNQWSGVEDASISVWTAHDQKNLYVAFNVRDDIPRKGDEVVFQFDLENYRRWEEDLKPEHTIRIPAPDSDEPVIGRNKAVVRTPEGYRGEFAIPLSKLGIKPDGKIGFYVQATDMDLDPAEFKRLTRGKHPWRRETRLEWPVNPYFKGGREAQASGELQLK